MGIAPYKTFTFDGESSGNYGVYITGTGVFNAPERSVDMVEIAGRNGSFALDKGKFENIEVKYKVGIVDDSEADFADRVSDFRNWLCSKVGYCRLEDEYNPNEYRMAVYASGIELDHDLLIAGEAEITFDCKPQRWLTSGETAVSVADGGTLDNPTLFESEPLLAVKGYGNISFNGYSIDIENVVLGDIVLHDSAYDWIKNGKSSSYTYNDGLVNNGDTITINEAKFGIIIAKTSKVAYTIPTISNTNASFTASGRDVSVGTFSRLEVNVTAEPLTFSAGTDSTITNTVSGSNTYITFSFTVSISYLSATREFVMAFSNITYSWNYIDRYSTGFSSIHGDSTVSALGNPTYIDCDIGECYMLNANDEIITLNSAIDLGSDLPKLVSGTNTFNYDNTITNFTVTPRWWKV